jgi:hypothetical protein
MMRRIGVATLSLTALVLILALNFGEAGEFGKANLTQEEIINKEKDRQIAEEQILKREFDLFQQQVLQLKQWFERSAKPGDRDKVNRLQRALDQAKKRGMVAQFERLIDYLKKHKFTSSGEVEEVYKRSAKLADDLRVLTNLVDLNAVNHKEGSKTVQGKERSKLGDQTESKSGGAEKNGGPTAGAGQSEILHGKILASAVYLERNQRRLADIWYRLWHGPRDFRFEEEPE